MKKSLLFIGAALLTFAACNRESVEPQINIGETIDLAFTSVRPQLEVETKTEWNEALSAIAWSNNDKIRVAYTLNDNWMGKEAAGTAKLYASGSVSIDTEDPTVGTFVVPVSTSGFTNPGTNGTYVFYGLYPSTSVSSTDAANAPVVSISVPSTQTPKANSFDPAADILVGKSKSLTVSGIPTEAIEIDWTRVVAHGFLTFKDLKNVEEGETITEITLTAQDEANLAGSENVSLADGSFNASHASNKLVIEGTNLSIVSETVSGVAMNNLKVWISILPETITSLDVDIETDKAHYTRSITGISKEFKQNAKNNLVINMGSATRTAKTAAPRLIDDGDYILTISSTDGGDKMMAAASSTPQKAVATATEIKNGKYQAEKDAVWTITYNTVDGTYSFKSLSKEQYLSGASTATDLSLASEPTYFTASQVSEGVYIFSVTGSGSTRYISYNYNNGSDRFALYTTNVDYIKNITVLPAEAIEEQEIIETPKAGTDVLNLSFTAVSGSSYVEWGPTQGSATNAYYIGQSAGGNESIQLRSSNNNSGIVVNKSSGYVKSVTVSWNSNTSNGRTLDIYGKHTAYDAATDLYASDATKQGTKVGSITKGTSTTYTFTDNFEYIGLRSSSGAMYLTSISIEWGTEPFAAKVATPVISFDSSTNQVSISCDTDGAAIYYTTDNTNPTSSSTLYASPIQLTSGDSFTVKAIAIKSGMNNSEIASESVAYYSGSAGEKKDIITASMLAATGTSYTDFSNVSYTGTGHSDAVYAGSSALNEETNIQLRSKNSNSGIFTTTSGGKVKSIKINVASGSNTIDVYGKNSAYTAIGDLYSTDTQATKIGSVSATGTITVENDYEYIGIRSNNGAVYISSIEITWN